jgi:hypothetical protein
MTSCCTTRLLTTPGHTIQGRMPDNETVFSP